MATETMSKESAVKKTANIKSNNAGKDPLGKFFSDALKDMLWAENAILDALPKMRQAATTEELKDALEDHELQTRKHISRLEKVFNLVGEKAEPKKCDAMAGIIKEGEHIISSTPDGSMTRDAALIIAAQKVEHYEIASYGGLVQLALTLNHDEAARLLDKTLQEEEKTDMDLTEIAESYINFEAGEENDTESSAR
jgi:ferritin-like metal-binding protein YciE